ncbi:DUF1367 family protein [Paraburkholderia sp. BR10936]|uniref:DUF1367 family protein n=1 Tax=Paraburkholderia sp. BR10936 TaxID=3236993 RepID=UPI0034D190AF
MSRIVLTKTPQGIEGMTDADERCFDRFNAYVQAMPVGETIAFSWTEPRSHYWHAVHFGLLKRLFQSQRRFETPEALRAWVTVGAGHCDLVPGPDGVTVAAPRSISYESLDDAAFQLHHQRCITFLRTPAALVFLWPAARPGIAERGIERILASDDG